jgi:hypothetical protein
MGVGPSAPALPWTGTDFQIRGQDPKLVPAPMGGEVCAIG